MMVADRHAARHAPTFRRSPLFPVPAGTRALSQTSNVIMQREGVEIASFSLPSLQGALALKGAAFLVDQRDHMRHVEDGIVLLSCIQEVSEIREGLAKRSRKRIRSLLKETSENRRVWRTLPSDVQLRAREVLGDMSRAFDVTGTDNSWTQAAQQDLSLRSPKLPVSGQSRRGDRGLGNTAGGGNKGSFAPHLRTEADGSALGSSPHRD
ncbi:hypothetical protein [Leucobacter exalbidus]|uniref:hypothetical protein n=1 Tax=Leucobacter exalbidus TaxID=662960 RepID=UPI001AE425EB|nr:hypothetical protein [Leucobacter exalbidus]